MIVTLDSKEETYNINDEFSNTEGVDSGTERLVKIMPDETTMEEEENPLETSRSNDVSLRESRLKDSMQEI